MSILFLDFVLTGGDVNIFKWYVSYVCSFLWIIINEFVCLSSIYYCFL